jgi:DNA-binding GntR family transcriptional regulator
MSNGAKSGAATAPEVRKSLVDVAEDALRTWLATGRHRVGDRLPPEQELSQRLGISRGTLRTALQRLEQSGEIVRRQGSGTFVGRAAASGRLDEGLEKLVSYSELARRRGVRLELASLEIEARPLGDELGKLFDCPADTLATTVTRVLTMDDEPGAHMHDVIRPDIELPAPAVLRRTLERGKMVLDVLLAEGVPVAYNTLNIAARVLTGRQPVGKALGLTEATAVLQIEHSTCTADDTPVEHSTDIFLPRSLDLHVVRWLEDSPPVPAIGRSRGD